MLCCTWLNKINRYCTCATGVINLDVVQVGRIASLAAIQRVECLLIQETWRVISSARLGKVWHLLTATDKWRTVTIHVIICPTDDCILDYNYRSGWIGALDEHLSIWICVEICWFPVAEGVRWNKGRPEQNWNIVKIIQAMYWFHALISCTDFMTQHCSERDCNKSSKNRIDETDYDIRMNYNQLNTRADGMCLK